MALVKKLKEIISEEDSLKSKAIKLALDKLTDVVRTKPMGGPSNVGTGGDNARYGAVVLNNPGLSSTKAPWVVFNSHPCHAYMRDYKNALVVFNQYGHRSFINPEADRAWFDFITSDTGPWREFVGRSISHVPDGVPVEDFIFTNGWVWSDLDHHPANLQHNFLVASRMAAEWPKDIERWHNLVSKNSLDPAMTFLFLDIFNNHGQGGKTQWVINHTNKYDWPVDICTSSEAYAKNFCKGRVEKLNKPFSQSSSYIPVNRIFGVNTLSTADPKAYPNRIFELYSSKFGPSEKDCQAQYEKKSGFGRFNFSTSWYVSEADIVEIIRLETKRLK
jgi:hypothetical protein